jgi:hypothetical protein
MQGMSPPLTLAAAALAMLLHAPDEALAQAPAQDAAPPPATAAGAAQDTPHDALPQPALQPALQPGPQAEPEAGSEAWEPGLMTWVLAGISAAVAIRLGAWAARRRHSAR